MNDDNIRELRPVGHIQSKDGERREMAFQNWDLPETHDHFAMHALQGLLAAGPHDCSPAEIAADAWRYADAMMALKKKHAASG